MPYRAFTLCLICALTAACGGQGSSSSANNINTSPLPFAPDSRPSAQWSAADFRAAVADDRRAAFLTETDPNDIPLGRATYDGHIRSEALVNGAGGYDLIGELRLNIDISTRQPIAGENTIDGSVSDLTLIDRFQGDTAEALTGRLDIAGDMALGEIEATAHGIIARDTGMTRQDDTAEMTITLDGSLRNDFGRGDVVTGDVAGGTTFDTRNDFEIDLIGDGRFFGED